MARTKNMLRGGAVLLGVGAILAAAATPGAVAQSSGPASANITRALLTQADAANSEIVRQLLVTQIQVDGEGDISFDVPVVEGAAPKNMDGFGGPTVENGQAVYNISANGPETFRTQQDGGTVDVPVKLTVKAKLNGQPIEPTDLKDVTGKVELTYTASNLTSTPTTLKFENGAGEPVEEDIDIVTSMGGTLDITFPPSWSNFSSEDVEVISGDGSGSTLVSGGFTLMEPFGQPTGSITIKADVTNGSMPPAVLQFLVLEPKDNPTARTIAENFNTGVNSGQDIFAGGKTLDEGADQLIEGLTTAVDGATQIADGVEFTLLDGVNRLWESFSEGAKDKAANADTQLVETVRGEEAYKSFLGSFDTLNGPTALFKIQNILGKVIDQLASPFDPTILKDGEFDSGSQTANSLISTLVFGATKTKGNEVITADTPQVGLTNPNCNKANPSDPKNPCGIAQLIDIATEKLAAVPDPLAVSDVQAPLAAARKAIAGENGWPGGCTLNPEGAFEDPYGCYYSGLDGAVNIVSKNTNLSSLMVALGLSLGKGPVTTDGPFNPTKQIDSSFNIPGLATFKDTLKFGVCPGPEAEEDAVSTHCSAAQVLSFLAAGVSGSPQPNFTQNTVTLFSSKVATTPWSNPVSNAVAPGCPQIPNSYPPKTIPESPKTEDLTPYGLACAVQALKDGLNNILLPTIAVGVQEETVASLGNGVYSPDCNPDTTPTLTCGISAIRAGIIDPLQPGTRQLADGLPAALDGVKTVKTDGAGELMKKGDEAAQDFGRRVALYNAMNNPELVSKYIPGGAPTGDDITYNGVYKFELAGVGSQGTNTGTNMALGALGLLAAIGAGAFAASRRNAA